MPSDDVFLAKVVQRACCNPPTLRNTLELCERAIREHIPGDFVECGVFAGAHPAVMAHVLMKYGVNSRDVHMFDSFEGIPHAGPHDDQTITNCIGKNQDGALVSSGVSVCTVEQVQQHMAEWGVNRALLRYNKGWFQHTMPLIADDIRLQSMGIAVLRLDGDLYESTMVCLKYLYPLVKPGGFVIIDDYALTGCRRAVRESGIFRGNPPPAVQEVIGGDGPVWFRKAA